MQSSHNDLLLKGQVTAIKLCQTSMLVQGCQILVQFLISWNDAYKSFPFYVILNFVTIFPHAYGFLLFARYYCNDAPLNRACLPIASLILCFTTFILIFQITFIQLKDIGSGHITEEIHIGVSAENDKGFSGQQQSWRARTNPSRSSVPEKKKPTVQPTMMEIPNADSLLGFLVPLIGLAIYWAVAYSAFDAYAQRYMPANQRRGQGSGICPCFGKSRSAGASSSSNGRSSQVSNRQQQASSQAQGRPDNNTVIRRIMEQNRQRKEQREQQQQQNAQVVSSTELNEVELQDQQYQRALSESLQEFNAINTESSGDDDNGDKRQQDFEDDLEDSSRAAAPANRRQPQVPGESPMASQLRQLAMNRNRSKQNQ